MYESYLNEAFVFRKAVERCQLVNEINAHENKSPNGLPYTLRLFRLSQQWLTAWTPAAPYPPPMLSFLSPPPHTHESHGWEREPEHTLSISWGIWKRAKGSELSMSDPFPKVASQIHHSFWGLGREPEWQSAFLPMEMPRVRNKGVPPSLHLLVFVSSNVLKDSNLSVISWKIVGICLGFQPKSGTTGSKLLEQKKQQIKASASRLHHCPAHARHSAVPVTAHPGSKV